MFWGGLIIGFTAGVITLAIFAANRQDGDNTIDGCAECRARMCADCELQKELRGLEDTLKTERRRSAAYRGEMNKLQGQLWYSQLDKREGMAV